MLIVDDVVFNGVLSIVLIVLVEMLLGCNRDGCLEYLMMVDFNFIVYGLLLIIVLINLFKFDMICVVVVGLIEFDIFVDGVVIGVLIMDKSLSVMGLLGM